MSLEPLLLTPELAVELLDTGSDSRVYVTKLLKFCAALRDGGFANNSPTIITLRRSDGKIYDGTHRCAAVAVTGIPLNVMVRRNDGIRNGLYMVGRP